MPETSRESLTHFSEFVHSFSQGRAAPETDGASCGAHKCELYNPIKGQRMTLAAGGKFMEATP